MDGEMIFRLLVTANVLLFCGSWIGGIIAMTFSDIHSPIVDFFTTCLMVSVVVPISIGMIIGCYALITWAIYGAPA
jgi:hypothetical protein